MALFEQDESAEKLAVTVQFAPFAVNPVKLYDAGEVNGGLKVCVPPHGDETVRVPVVGGFTKFMEPETLYKLLLQADGVEEIEIIEQLHELGAE